MDPIPEVHGLSQPSLVGKFQDSESLSQKPRWMASEKLYLKRFNCPTYIPVYKKTQSNKPNPPKNTPNQKSRI